MIHHFSSIRSLRAKAIDLGAIEHFQKLYGSDTAWLGESRQETEEWSLTGNRALVPEAEKLLSRLSLNIETPKRTFERAPVGAFCVVPDVLAGLPTPMRRQIQTTDDRQPISIYVRPNASSAVDAAMLQKRGTAILAFALAMARSRPTNLYWYFVSEGRNFSDGCKEDVLVARIETAPLDLSMACYALSSAGLYRRIGFGLVEKLGGRIQKLISQQRSETIATELLGANPQSTLVIGPADIRDQLLVDPVAWIQNQINRFNQKEGDL